MVRLGPRGQWERQALEDGEIPLGHVAVPHELCEGGRWDEVAKLISSQGHGKRRANAAAQDLQHFYSAAKDDLWITLSKEFLWWGFAEPEVHWLGGNNRNYGARVRRLREGWNCMDLRGDPLVVDRMGSGVVPLMRPGRYVDRVENPEAILRRINATEPHIVARARSARRKMIAAAEAMIAQLDWADFVTLIDMIFGRSGWRRISAVNARQLMADFIIEDLTTSRTAQVLVHPHGDQSTLQAALNAIGESSYDQAFFVCQTPNKSLSEFGRDELQIWTGDRLANVAIKAGLYDWLMERSG